MEKPAPVVPPVNTLTSYARPDTALSLPALAARELGPLHPELSDGELPPPTDEGSRSILLPGFSCHNEYIPSARPRSHPSATTRKLRPPYPPDIEADTSAKGKARRAAQVEELLRNMKEQRRAMTDEPSWAGDPKAEPQLWNVITLCTRVDEVENGVSLLFAHANGFPKEIWKPVIIRLLELDLPINEIVLWEAVNHGTSALYNADSLGDTFDWIDNARDVLQLLTHFPPRAGNPRPNRKGEPLRRKRDDLPSHREKTWHYPMVGIGHSLGGGTLARVALHDPSLFAGLVLVDPIIVPEHPGSRRESEAQRYDSLIKGALARRPVWPDIKQATASFSSSPFFQTWDKDALHMYLTHGLIDHPSGKGVMLKQAPYDEAAVFTEPRAPAEVWNLMPTLPKKVPLKWIMSGKGASATGGEEQTAHTVWRRPENSENVRIPDAGHLIPQEKPNELAEEIAKFLRQKVLRNIKARAAYAQARL